MLRLVYVSKFVLHALLELYLLRFLGESKHVISSHPSPYNGISAMFVVSLHGLRVVLPGFKYMVIPTFIENF